MCKCDSQWILKPWCRIEGSTKRIYSWRTNYDVTDGLGRHHARAAAAVQAASQQSLCFRGSLG